MKRAPQPVTMVRENIVSPDDKDGPLFNVKALPANIEAEQALLGALLHNNLAYEKISEFLIPHHFADAAHQKIFHIISTLIDKGHVADPITLKDYLTQAGSLEDIGGANYIVQLAKSVISLTNVQEYGRLIYDLFLRRQLINVSEEIREQAFNHDPAITARDQIEEAEKRLFDLATDGHSSTSFKVFKIALGAALTSAEKAFRRDSHIVGVTTGIQDIDQLLGGMHPSDLIIIAGRPSMGKTALATNFAYNAARAFMKNKDKGAGAKIAFFSLEMSAEQLATRLLAQEAGISSDRIRRGELKDHDFARFVEVAKTLNELPLFIDDTPALSIASLRTRARRLKRQENIGMIVIDYLQLLSLTSLLGKRSEGRVQEVSEITRNLKAIGKELDIPVIALSQLSRAVEQRDDKKPQLADLRESGSIEQDADVVMFVYREEYYLARQEPQPGTDKHREWQEKMAQVYNTAEVIVAKQRHGPIGNIKLYFDGMLTKFGNFKEERYLPEKT